MSEITAHIINHTHWDREWFLTSEYTNRWIGGLIDKIGRLVEENLGFQYFLDGQTLVIEDLLALDPHYREPVERLVKEGNLLVGPYYCQPDWRLTGGEALLRNLLYGWQDIQKYGVKAEAGWLVDTFGHISQAPQLHRLFDISAVYIWRGSPLLEPYFHWEGPDGSRLFTTNLFGGYRNLYGVTRTPEIAVRRLQAELEKLRPYYPTPDIPLFDGYDLEDNPEDPISFYRSQAGLLPEGIQLVPASPDGFAKDMCARLEGLPVLLGELNSGKFGAVFPGSLSTRTYLKVMAGDCESLLYRTCEPLAVLALYAGRSYPSNQYEVWSRALLRNAVHDCICGVSIDQVHEKMELSYRQIFQAMGADLQESLAHILEGYKPGFYCASTSPFRYEGWQVLGDRLYPLRAEGVGVWPAGEDIPVRRANRAVESFAWQNDHYEAQVLEDGRLRIANATLGKLLVYEEHGDAYSEEPGALLGVLEPEGELVVEQESELHAVLRQEFSLEWQGGEVSVVARLTFDYSPLLRWQVELNGRGVNYRVEMVFETDLNGQIEVGMPFDTLLRAPVDRDLLPRNLSGKLAVILIGQRELEEVRTFPFHEFVAISDGGRQRGIFARGLYAYQAREDGRVSVPLLRAVEWLAKSDLPGRLGDAGPSFYVPDARCERTVTHELALAWLEGEADKSEQLPSRDLLLYQLNASYQNPPLLVEVVGEPGENTHSGVERPDDMLYLREDVPMSSLHYHGGKVLARMFNPSERSLALSRSYQETDVHGTWLGQVDSIPAKHILTLEMDTPNAAAARAASARVKVLNLPAWRVGANQGSPDPAVLVKMRKSIERLEREVALAEVKVRQTSSREVYRRQHRVYVLKRELLEQSLSLLLNEIKLGMAGQVTYEYLYEPDEQVAEIGYELNQLRIQRRIYDYVVQMEE